LLTKKNLNKKSTLVNRDFFKRDFALNEIFSVRFGFATKSASCSGIYRSVIGISQDFGQRSKNKIESVEIDDLGVLLGILLQTEAPMGKGLSVQQKRKLCEYRMSLRTMGGSFRTRISSHTAKKTLIGPQQHCNQQDLARQREAGNRQGQQQNAEGQRCKVAWAGESAGALDHTGAVMLSLFSIMSLAGLLIVPMLLLHTWSRPSLMMNK
jgi:hypothetical protein